MGNNILVKQLMQHSQSLSFSVRQIKHTIVHTNTHNSWS